MREQENKQRRQETQQFSTYLKIIQNKKPQLIRGKIVLPSFRPDTTPELTLKIVSIKLEGPTNILSH